MFRNKIAEQRTSACILVSEKTNEDKTIDFRPPSEEMKDDVFEPYLEWESLFENCSDCVQDYCCFPYFVILGGASVGVTLAVCFAMPITGFILLCSLSSCNSAACAHTCTSTTYAHSALIATEVGAGVGGGAAVVSLPYALRPDSKSSHDGCFYRSNDCYQFFSRFPSAWANRKNEAINLRNFKNFVEHFPGLVNLIDEYNGYNSRVKTSLDKEPESEELESENSVQLHLRRV